MKPHTITHLLFTLAISTLLFLTSCGKLKGDGENVMTYSGIDSFISMDIDIPCHINIIHSDTTELMIEAQQNIIDNIAMWKENNVLHLEFTQKAYEYNPITLTFKMPEFRDVCIRDVSKVMIDSSFTTPSRIHFDISGTANIDFTAPISCLDFVYENSGVSTLNMSQLSCSRDLKLSSTGTSTINLASGEAESTYINVIGEMEFRAFDFVTENTTIMVTGEANPINVHVTNELEVEVEGNAKVRYIGAPTSIFIADSLGVLDINTVE